MKKVKNDQEIASRFSQTSPDPYISHTSKSLTPLCVRDQSLALLSNSLAQVADHHQLSTGNPACGSLSALNSIIPSWSGTSSVDYPLAFMAEQLAQVLGGSSGVRYSDS